MYIAVLRDAAFAEQFRPRYLRDIPRTYLSSVVVQELLAGANAIRQQRLAAHLYAPFERVGRVVTPTHKVWKDAGGLIARLAGEMPNLRSKLSSGFLNDVLIALSARAAGAAVVTRNRQDFELIRDLSQATVEVI